MKLSGATVILGRNASREEHQQESNEKGASDHSCHLSIQTPGEALRVSLLTITTLGNEYIEPIKRGGRILASIEPVMGIILLVLVIGILFVELGKDTDKQKQ